MARTSKKARKSSPLNLPGAFELFTPSKNLVFKNIWIFGPIYGAVIFINLLGWSVTPASNTSWLSKTPITAPDLSTSASPVFGTLGFIGIAASWVVLLSLVSIIIQMVSQKAQLDASANQAVTFDKIFSAIKKHGIRLLGLYIVVGLVTLVGFFLFIIPGIIMLRRYFLSAYVLLDKGTGIRESMDISANMSKPYSSSIYSIILVMIGIGLIGIIPIVGWVASFVIGMLYTVAPALRFQQLKKLA